LALSAPAASRNSAEHTDQLGYAGRSATGWRAQLGPGSAFRLSSADPVRRDFSALAGCRTCLSRITAEVWKARCPERGCDPLLVRYAHVVGNHR
jgi:hypothetical protein